MLFANHSSIKRGQALKRVYFVFVNIQYHYSVPNTHNFCDETLTTIKNPLKFLSDLNYLSITLTKAAKI